MIRIHRGLALALAWCLLALAGAHARQLTGSAQGSIVDQALDSLLADSLRRRAAAGKWVADLSAAASLGASEMPFAGNWSSGAGATAAAAAAAPGAKGVAYAALPSPKRQPKAKVSRASILAGFTKVPADMLNPLIEFRKQFPELPKGCPSSMSIINYRGGEPMLSFFHCCIASMSTINHHGVPGRPGDTGAGDNADAIERSSASEAPLLYLPAGTFNRYKDVVYRVGRSVRLTKPLVVGCGASLQLDAGVVLTITAQPRLYCREPIFTGAGKVVFEGPSFEVSPWWFLQNRMLTEATQAALDSCPNSLCTLMLNDYIKLDKAVNVYPTNGVFATFRGTVWPKDSNSPIDGMFVLQAGTYKRQFSINTFGFYIGRAVIVLGGVKNAQILIGQFYIQGSGPGEGLVFRPGGGKISGVAVQNIGVCSTMTCVIVEGSGSLENVNMGVNFVIKGKPLLFRGKCTTLTNVKLQAHDPAGTAQNALRNDCPGQIKGLSYELSPWSGGYSVAAASSNPGQLIHGKFAKLTASIHVAGNFDTPNFFTLSGSAMPVGPGGVSPLEINTAGLFLEPKASAAAAMSSSKSSGCCWWSKHGDVPTKFLGTPQFPQAFYVRVPISGAWRPGETRRFYFRSWWAETASSAQMTYIPYRSLNPGLVVTAITNLHAQTRGKLKHVVELTVTNKGKESISTISGNGAAHRVGLQLGP